MSSTHTQDVVLSAELEAIAAAAHDRLRAEASEDLTGAGDAQRRVAEAAGAAITAGTALGAIAEAEHVGELRARRARRRDAQTCRARSEAQTRSGGRVRAGGQARGPTRSPPSRDRRGRRGIARNCPRDPGARDPERERQRVPGRGRGSRRRQRRRGVAARTSVPAAVHFGSVSGPRRVDASAGAVSATPALRRGRRALRLLRPDRLRPFWLCRGARARKPGTTDTRPAERSSFVASTRP
jgi:hypothetical protein